MNICDFLMPLLIWCVGLYQFSQSQWNWDDPLKQINQSTSNTLNRLVQTKYFSIIRLNINLECQSSIMNQICKSQSCTVYRCNNIDIPECWTNTQKVKRRLHDIDLWQYERENSIDSWVWNVQEEANDQWDYFDIHTNIESFTNYNGSFIWKLIYQDYCFKNGQELMCAEQNIFYKIISGLHTSISTHLSRFYKYSAEQNLWADLSQEKEKFHFNHTEYQERVLDHPERIRNLFFLYRILAKAIIQVAPELITNFTIASDDVAQDIQAKKLLSELVKKLQGSYFSDKEKQALNFFTLGHSMVKQYQKYIQNISSILNCVECEKCRLFGKMQTYGVGTAFKILLGYPTLYKRNEIVALLNVFNKISMSVDTYYTHRKEIIWLGYEKPNKGYFAICKIFLGFLCLLYILVRWKPECQVTKRSQDQKNSIQCKLRSIKTWLNLFYILFNRRNRLHNEFLQLRESLLHKATLMLDHFKG